MPQSITVETWLRIWNSATKTNSSRRAHDLCARTASCSYSKTWPVSINPRRAFVDQTSAWTMSTHSLRRRALQPSDYDSALVIDGRLPQKISPGTVLIASASFAIASFIGRRGLVECHDWMDSVTSGDLLSNAEIMPRSLDRESLLLTVAGEAAENGICNPSFDHSSRL
jgi:hypothetical protein